MSLTIFRGFRLLRVFRLFSKWKTFHKMIVKIGETLKDIITFFFLLLIIVFVFSLLGVELFKNKAKINRFNDIVDAEDPMGYSPR
jgi:p-aminobenzoyl-glutamate transporter AbgT